MRNNILNNLFNYSTILVIFTLILHHFFIFIERRKEKKEYYNIFFTIFGLSSIIYILFSSNLCKTLLTDNQIHLITPTLTVTTILGMFYGSINFLFVLFDFQEKYKKYFNLSYICVVIASLLTLFNFIFGYQIYMDHIFFLVVLFNFISVIILLTGLIYLVIKEKKFKSFIERITFIGYLILICFFCIDKLFEALNIPYFLTNNYIGVGITSFIFTIALAKRFNHEHFEYERVLLEHATILESKVLERTHEIEEANKRLKEENQKRIDFFVNITHETRTPLSLISNYFDEYLKKVKPTKELLNIKSNFEKLLSDMLNFLDLEKLNRNQIFYDHNQIVNIIDILKNKIELFKITAKRRRIEIISNITSDIIYIKIDAFAIERIINNILDNAIKYNKDKGRITILLNYTNDKVELIIKDTGIGIPENEMKFLFEPYHQMSHEKRQIQGLGMGLFIVKRIVDEVKGEIIIESKLNEGTTAKIIFLKYELQENDNAQKDIEYSRPMDYPDIELMPETYDKDKSNIFVVEDNFEFVYFLQNSLSDKYNFYYSTDGIKALDKINYIPKPDIIISDIMMPNMDGFLFYDEIKKIEIFMDIPFIFVTARTEINDKLKGLKDGAADYITKPIVIDELTAKIKNLIERKKKNEDENKEIIESTQKLLKFASMTKEESYQESFKNKCRKYNITEKEGEIINLIINGNQNKEIAVVFSISENAIKKNIGKIFKKIGINNRIELITLFKE
jgi:signal transduction histidine kinase/DNA-binding NarL/FixJ family response regulator